MAKQILFSDEARRSLKVGMDVLANTAVTDALLYGGLLGLVTALYYYLRYTTSNPRFSTSTLGRGLWEGVRSMLPAVYILLLAWMLGSLIAERA